MSEPESGKEGEGGESAFRVIDRRRFTADGREREPDSEAISDRTDAPGSAPAGHPSPEPRETRSEEPRPHAAATREADSPRASQAASESELARPTGEPYDDEVGLPIEPTFSTLLMSLSTQALMCLGEIPEVAGQPPRRDLAAARSVIDLIGVLERKTRGNLDAGEAALLERILYDLRIRFVEVSRS